ncbi:unnamed protein product [Rotaria sp. Silwood1]|nr:unnamed protein product [Rotaria sp. Silwood1]
MSDTSIIAGDSLGYNDIYEMENYADDSRDSCCTRHGTQVCVCILALSAIFIVIVMVFFIFGPYDLLKLRKVKGPKNGQHPSSTNSEQGFFNAFTNIWSSSSGTAETSYNDQAYGDEETYDSNNENIDDY